MSKSEDCEEILKQIEKDAGQFETITDYKKMVDMYNTCCLNIEKVEQKLNSYTYIMTKPSEFAESPDDVSLEEITKKLDVLQKKMDGTKTTLDVCVNLFLEGHGLIESGKKQIQEQKLNIETMG